MTCPSHAWFPLTVEVNLSQSATPLHQFNKQKQQWATSYGTTHSSCPRKNHIKSHICVLKNHVHLQNQQMCQLTWNKRSLLSAPQPETLGLLPHRKTVGSLALTGAFS